MNRGAETPRIPSPAKDSKKAARRSGVGTMRGAMPSPTPIAPVSIVVTGRAWIQVLTPIPMALATVGVPVPIMPLVMRLSRMTAVAPAEVMGIEVTLCRKSNGQPSYLILDLFRPLGVRFKSSENFGVQSDTCNTRLTQLESKRIHQK